MSGNRAERLLQCSGPVLQCLIDTDRCISVFKSLGIFHDTHNGVAGVKIAGLPVLHLADDRAEVRIEQVLRSHVVLDAESQSVAECHLAQRHGEALGVYRVSAQNPSRLHVLEEGAVLTLHVLEIRNVILISVDLYQDQLAAGLLQLRADDIADGIDVHRK